MRSSGGTEALYCSTSASVGCRGSFDAMFGAVQANNRDGSTSTMNTKRRRGFAGMVKSGVPAAEHRIFGLLVWALVVNIQFASLNMEKSVSAEKT